MNRLMRAASKAWAGAIITVTRSPRGWDGDAYYRAEARRAVVTPPMRYQDQATTSTWLAGQAHGNSPREALRNLIAAADKPAPTAYVALTPTRHGIGHAIAEELNNGDPT